MTEKITNLTFGSDPEFFLLDKTTDKIVPAVGLVGGTKDKGIFIPTGESVLEDNVMVEFTTTICKTPRQITESVNRALAYLREKLDKKYEFLFKAAHQFDWEDLATEQAMEIGCSPDYNAYTKRTNDAPNAQEINWRSAAAHIHIGYDNPDIDSSLTLIKLLDLYLGVPSVILDEDRDRRKLYGKAGCFRLKSYGFEYRVLSNFWITNPELVEWVISNINQAVDMYNITSDISDINWEEVRYCVNNYDEHLAEVLVEKFAIGMPTSFNWEKIKITNQNQEVS